MIVGLSIIWASDSQVPYGDGSAECSDLQRRMQAMGQTDIRAARYPAAWYVRTADFYLLR